VSEPATEAPPAPKKPAGKGTGLTRKVGPLPVWGWAAGSATAAVAFVWWRGRHKTAAGSATAATTASTSTSSTDAQLAAELQELLNEQSGNGAGPGGGGSTGTGGGSSLGGTTVTTTGTSGGTTTKTTTSTKTGTGTGTTTKTTSSTKTGTGTGGTAPTAKPHAPRGLSVAGITDSRATVKWDSVAAATKYRVRVWHGSDVIHDATEQQTAQNITGLKPKTEYGWHVAGVNAAGTGAWSAQNHFTTK
jgi:hypothetical protein